MRSAKKRLAGLAVLAVVLTMAAATIAFNLFIGWKIESDATRDIEYALDWESDDVGTGRSPNFLSLDAYYRIDPDERRFSTEEETNLAAWFAQHPAEGVVNRVTLSNWTCYAAMVSKGEYLANYEAHGAGSPDVFYGPIEPGYYVAYIDIAGSYQRFSDTL